ncbi:hypothetical protein COMA2_90073 [Candidatus Nitrospira nitrificans]|uniref:Uncharacterized protein n=1 Tax=Candidatus Nitrospira nitrificans TaxID=1742973 RepID=A0A0S4LVP2_9BACT|nr:hypothetical protein COMA2_90073 [Candidatus Nitrospira nitrificans]
MPKRLREAGRLARRLNVRVGKRLFIQAMGGPGDDYATPGLVAGLETIIQEINQFALDFVSPISYTYEVLRPCLWGRVNEVVGRRFV